MLRLSLGPGPKDELLLRQGRAIGWLEEALAPLRGRLTQSELRRLVLAIRSTCGIEPLVWLTDVGGLSRQEAGDLMRWSALTLLRAALDDILRAKAVGDARARRRLQVADAYRALARFYRPPSPTHDSATCRPQPGGAVRL